MSASFCIFIGCIVIFEALAADFPKNWKACHVSDKSRGKCLREAAQLAYTSLLKGERNLGVPPLDPLHVDRTDVKDSGKAKKLLDVTTRLSNYVIVGYKSGIVDNFKFDCKKLVANFDISMKDDVILQGHYNGSGKVMMLPVSGNSDFKFVFHGYKLHVDMKMTPTKKNGVNYLQLGTFALKISITGGRVQFDNLFQGNKPLGDNMNKIFDDNFMALFDEISDSLDESYGKFLARYVGMIVNKIPLSQLCPA